jgi:hypothetical protein
MQATARTVSKRATPSNKEKSNFAYCRHFGDSSAHELRD